MRRVSRFQRDFEDLHGPRSFRRVEIVEEQPARLGYGAALVIGSLSLFWVIVLGLVVLSMVIVGGVFVWALLTSA